MRVLIVGCLVVLLTGTGCVHRKPKNAAGDYSAVAGLTDVAPPPAQASAASNSSPSTQPAITPGAGLTGKVKSVNPTARFVILSFPLGRLPSPDQQFSVYRRGAKVGEIKITSQQLNDLVVADITDGDAAEGDEVRSR